MFLIGTVAIAAVVGIFYAIVFGLDASSIDLGNRYLKHQGQIQWHKKYLQRLQ
jgi:L-cystine uptake protein TcyP (sodium:dicarboxylate symporter family)